MSLLGGTYGSRELEINSNDAKRGDGCLQGDLNLAAGAADASRAMLRALCLNVAHRIAVLAHAHFLSTAKPTAYR
jgi:hypothetical protein